MTSLRKPIVGGMLGLLLIRVAVGLVIFTEPLPRELEAASEKYGIRVAAGFQWLWSSYGIQWGCAVLSSDPVASWLPSDLQPESFHASTWHVFGFLWLANLLLWPLCAFSRSF
jgi:hypothetical protein